MDVRCDRCETEYELDDAIVADGGASVQCTTCGHTFTVTRRPPTIVAPIVAQTPVSTPPKGAVADEPAVPEWTLSTEEGKVHRFRDLNTLQKWIVERKVARTDRMSRVGGPWLTLGDVVELTPFFNVVDEADRARASAGLSGGMPTAPRFPSSSRGPASADGVPSEPLRAHGSGSVPPPVPADARRPISEDGPTVPNRQLPSSLFASSLPGIRSPGTGTANRLSGTPSSGRPNLRSVSAPAAAGASSSSSAAVLDPSLQAATSVMAIVSPDTHASLTPSSRLSRADLGVRPNITTETDTLESDSPGSTPGDGNKARNVTLTFMVLLLAGGGGFYWWWTGKRAHEASAPGSSAGPPLAAKASPAAAAPEPPHALALVPRPGAALVPKPAGSSGVATGPLAVAPPGGGRSPTAGRTSTVTNAGASARSGSRATADLGKHDSSGDASKQDSPSVGGASSLGAGYSYDRLVAEGSRLLQQGKFSRADKLYAQALAVRPDGVAALTGAARSQLQRQRPLKAIDTFRRALAIEQNFEPALFGIAEAYRARGDTARALGAYREYLDVAPDGADAPAAKRRIGELEASGTSSPASDGSSTEEPVPDLAP